MNVYLWILDFAFSGSPKFHTHLPHPDQGPPDTDVVALTVPHFLS